MRPPANINSILWGAMANNKVWKVGDKVKSNDNKYSGTVSKIVDANHVNVNVSGHGDMQFRNRELKRQFGG
ncbi:hypothetical protein HWB79_gp143 [Streptomyces phage LukeCage]|jgi:cytochrome c556|uniref:Uncharacterized protein n=1 Tax=Streptomyces phage LukeCage TaxID=2283304 RepID=A0A345MGI7_9CAUD|nr:hypothetical protein HWB79_gp143 [Streptomyces phage LukeCage]AXH69668.1 hypothetical protein SEA_LUKECAGE_169 [Streptomyces phage LukeCage]QFP97457.1 hypothetical protein SEA_ICHABODCRANE_165 [Streptomyces phage IchabodCrane]QGH79033.1 hypothetical protein SEA_TOMSAWYER_174 [Streptomyces phage TomSawyer]QPL13779.1 hypothetical protein SEA_MINDFLAYER_165 [Streptomyces phage MindFlayer]